MLAAIVGGRKFDDLLYSSVYVNADKMLANFIYVAFSDSLEIQQKSELVPAFTYHTKS